MDSSRPIGPSKLLTLQEAASVLAVSVDVLLRWNEHQILKPTITQTGHIGYTQEQIDQFLKIQQSLRLARATSIPELSKATTESPSRFLEQVAQVPETTAPTTLQNNTPLDSNTRKSSSLRFFTSIGVVLSIVIIVILFQQGQFNSFVSQYEKTYQNPSADSASVLGAKTSALQLDPSSSSSQGVTLNKNSQDESKSAFSTKTSSPLFANKQPTTNTSTHPAQSPIATVAAVIKSQLVPKAQAQDKDESPFADTTTQNTTPSNNTLFDKTGNITGKTTQQADVLAMNVVGAGLGTNTQQANPAGADARNQLILLVIASSGMILFLIKKPNKTFPAIHIDSPAVVSQKFLEIDQRMDGTVVLYFQGKDYKISKPELHSDSDRFFERLMEVVGPGVKEIEYDNYNDERMRLSTPLSRLVTRLGFVGIKRDLFFPRTSKHNVLFRKYITREDLQAMNLVPDQVAKELLQTFPN